MSDRNDLRSLDIQAMRNVAGMKSVAVVLSLVVYLAVVVYSEYHFYNLVSQFVTGAFQIIGIVAVAASFITAVALPLALHFWFRSGGQQVFGFVFYWYWFDH